MRIKVIQGQGQDSARGVRARNIHRALEIPVRGKKSLGRYKPLTWERVDVLMVDWEKGEIDVRDTLLDYVDCESFKILKNKMRAIGKPQNQTLST